MTGRKKRLGRRPMPASAKRTERVLVSLRKAEMRRLERLARAAEVPVAVFVRDCLIECLDDREVELSE